MASHSTTPPLDFDRIFVRYFEATTYYFTRRGFSKEEGQELAQEVFLKAFQGRKLFRGEADVKTWLYTIAANIYRNELRRRSAGKRAGKEESLERDLETQDESVPTELPDLDVSKDPYRRLEAKEQSRRMEETLKQLPPRMQRCLHLRFHEGLKYREIADVMQISIQTVKSTIHQARERLKEKLADLVPDGSRAPGE